MNRGFAFYFKNAMKSSAKTIWKNKGLLLVTAYFLSELVARLTIIFSAVFDLADIRQAKIVAENERFDVPQTLKVATKSKPVWTMVLSIIAEAFIFLGGVLIIAAITCVLALIGYAVHYVIGGPMYVIWLFCIPGGLLLLVYAVVMVLIFSPTPYIIETNPGLGVYETIKICFDSMKGKGKVTAFFNFFIPTLLELLVVGFCLGGAWAIKTFVPLKFYMPVILAGWGIISLVLILMLVPMFDLSKKLAQKSLFEDIVLDPVNANKRTSGINIKMCTGVKFEPGAVKDNLVALFDQTQSDSVPAPDSPARRKIKENAEKASKNKSAVKEAKEQPKKEESGNKPSAEQPKLAPEQSAAAEEVNPQSEEVLPDTPVQPEETQPEHTPLVKEEIAEVESNEAAPFGFPELTESASDKAAGGQSEEFDLDQFVPKEFDLDKFIDAQVAETQFVPTANEPSSEDGPVSANGDTVQTGSEEPAAEEKPKRTRTAKPKAQTGSEESAAEAKPKRTRTAKPKAQADSEESAEAEKPKTRTTRKKTSD